MKNPIPLFFIFFLAIILSYGFYMAGLLEFPGAQAGATAPPSTAQHACKDGQTQYCKLGNCSGFSMCTGGVWGGCRWERICSPGSMATCLENNCPYALKECNECGSGYGPCIGINASGG
ncbi:MAG: hypothetical protein V1861_03970 [Candidatus Micrarchaeota archaeon]